MCSKVFIHSDNYHLTKRRRIKPNSILHLLMLSELTFKFKALYLHDVNIPVFEIIDKFHSRGQNRAQHLCYVIL